MIHHLKSFHKNANLYQIIHTFPKKSIADFAMYHFDQIKNLTNDQIVVKTVNDIETWRQNQKNLLVYFELTNYLFRNGHNWNTLAEYVASALYHFCTIFNYRLANDSFSLSSFCTIGIYWTLRSLNNNTKTKNWDTRCLAKNWCSRWIIDDPYLQSLSRSPQIFDYLQDNHLLHQIIIQEDDCFRLNLNGLEEFSGKSQDEVVLKIICSPKMNLILSILERILQ